MQGLEKGRVVHYVHGDGTHAPATVTHVHDQERGVVDLDVTGEEGQGSFSRKTVVFSQEPRDYTWHFVEGEDTPSRQEALL